MRLVCLGHIHLGSIQRLLVLLAPPHPEWRGGAGVSGNDNVDDNVDGGVHGSVNESVDGSVHGSVDVYRSVWMRKNHAGLIYSTIHEQHNTGYTPLRIKHSPHSHHTTPHTNG